MEKILRYNCPAKAFCQALPMGNGALGAMIYGAVKKERISLNHDSYILGVNDEGRLVHLYYGKK